MLGEEVAVAHQGKSSKGWEVEEDLVSPGEERKTSRGAAPRREEAADEEKMKWGTGRGPCLRERVQLQHSTTDGASRCYNYVGELLLTIPPLLRAFLVSPNKAIDLGRCGHGSE